MRASLFATRSESSPATKADIDAAKARAQDSSANGTSARLLPWLALHVVVLRTTYAALAVHHLASGEHKLCFQCHGFAVSLAQARLQHAAETVFESKESPLCG